jgi:hypothetical protein
MKWLSLFFFILFFHFTASLGAQSSLFSTGKWAKIGVLKQGIVKLTGAQLKTLGLTVPMESAQLQLYSFNQGQLKEAVPAQPAMGLTENAIKVEDGGDGKIDEGDYILFYNEGKVRWFFNNLTNEARHEKLQNSDTVFFFLTNGGNGRRISNQTATTNANLIQEKFSQHFIYEVDSISFLNSGKTIWGLPMGQGAGKQSQILLPYTSQQMTGTERFKCNVHLASTSYQSNGQFNFYWNDQLAHTASLSPVSGLLFDDIATEKTDSFSSPLNTSWPNKSNLKINYTNTDNATGWIDFIEAHVKKSVGFWQDSTFSFSIEDDFVQGENYLCKLQNADATSILWNVTNPQNPQTINLQLDANNNASFYQKIDSAQSFFALKQAAFETPILLGLVGNQNTLNMGNPADYIIVSAPAYLNAAKKYQAFQLSKFGRIVKVLNAVELYNDFSGGQPSAIAIRNYLKYVSNKATENHIKPPAFLLLFGMGNFNSRKLNLNFELPVFESDNSISILSSYATDDFFATLKTNDDINTNTKDNLISLAVGRIPARSVQEADSVIDKLITYQTKPAAGSWANQLAWIADDGDYNLHLQDAEAIVEHLKTKESKWNHKKIYLDLYPAVSSTSGNSYPLANAALQQTIQEGALMINYTGHGNYLRLSEEAIISQAVFNSWNNASHLPLLVTASCNFAPYDQPNLSAIAWDAFMKNKNGVIGIVAANRLVFAYSNKQINDLFIQQLLVADSVGKYPSIGTALQKAKLMNLALGGDRVNALKFNLIGDPALQLVAPNSTLNITSINQKLVSNSDTLLLGVKNTIKGSIQQSGVVKNDFKGIVELSIYDAIKWNKTLANQSTSMSVPIATQESLLFKGRVNAVNGVFAIDFILPTQNTNVSSPIRIQVAANNDTIAALKVLDSIFVKRSGAIIATDTLGPRIKAYFNDTHFKQGDWASPNATLFIQLEDTSGIQSSGNALGHDISIYLDDNVVPILLNTYFVADINTYQSGKVQYRFSNLSEGKHFCVVKAWDLLGNGSKDTIWFEVPKSNVLFIKNSSVYPNPFRNKAKFSLETNLTGKIIQLVFEVFDQNGKMYYSNMSKFFNENTKVELAWDGITNAGTPLLPGFYYYQFTVEYDRMQSKRSGSFMKL